jgi:hypothetical protein
MSKIRETRLAVLEEATRRMRESDYNEFPFADTEELIRLLRIEASWRKELKSTRIVSLIEDKDEKRNAEMQNQVTEANNKRIEDTYLKPLEFKIKVLELEIMLFDGIYGIAEAAQDILKRVYPKEEEKEDE